MNLSLATQQKFNSVMCDVWTNEENKVFMTREQIGQALEYADPKKAVENIHARNKERLDKFSVTHKMRATDGKQYETTIYNEKGIYEIIRFSKQQKANDFYDFVYDLLEGLRTGEKILIQPKSEQDKLKMQMMRAEAMLNNSRTRQAKLILDMQKNKTLSPVAIELLQINALEIIGDNPIEHRPQVKKTYTATELGNEFGVTAHKIGRIANLHGLKTAEYGIEVLDKSRYSAKQVPSFRYNEKGKLRLKELLEV